MRSKAAPSSSTGPRTITTASTIPRSSIDENCILVIRGTGPIGYPGRRRGGEHAAARCAHQAGITSLPCIGDGRQSGTSGSPSILNASPEAAVGGGSGYSQDG